MTLDSMLSFVITFLIVALIVVTIMTPLMILYFQIRERIIKKKILKQLNEKGGLNNETKESGYSGKSSRDTAITRIGETEIRKSILDTKQPNNIDARATKTIKLH